MVQVSVLTASYGHGAYVTEAVESVLGQSLGDFCYLICEDGSPDHSWEIIQALAQKDARITAFQHPQAANKGLAATLCLLLEKVNTPWVAFLESDDVWQPNFLDVMLKAAAANPQASLLYCDIEPFGENLASQQKMLTGRRRYAQQPDKERADLLFQYPITTFSSVLIKTELLRSCNWNTPIANALDKYLWAQCLRSHEAVFVNNMLCRWRKHGKSYSDTAPGRNVADTWDMLFDVLYPGGRIADKAFMRRFLQGRFEKIFRNQLRFLVRLHMQRHYGRHGVHLKAYTPLPPENI